MFHNRNGQTLIDLYNDAGLEKPDHLDDLASLIHQHYPHPKWTIKVVKVIKPAEMPLGAVIGNYAVVDGQTTINHIVINDVKAFSIAEEHGIEEDDEIIGNGEIRKNYRKC